MPKVIGFNPVDLGFGGMINYSGKNNNKVLAKVKGGSYPKVVVSVPDPHYQAFMEARSEIVYVSPNGNNANDGATMDTPYTSIKYAVEQASVNAAIYLMPGTHNIDTNWYWTNYGYGYLNDNNKQVVFYGEPKQTILVNADDGSARDIKAVNFNNANSQVIGCIFDFRINAGKSRSLNYATSLFGGASYFTTPSYATNCVFHYTDAGVKGSLWYLNSASANPAYVDYCTFYNPNGWQAGYSSGGDQYVRWGAFNTVNSNVFTAIEGTTGTVTGQTITTTDNAYTGTSAGTGVYAGAYAWPA